MGNQNGKDSNVPTASPLDFFQTPPTTPTQAELTAMALSSAASPEKPQTPSPASTVTPSSPSPAAEWTQKLSAAPPEWAVMGADGVAPSESNVSDAAAVVASAGREKSSSAVRLGSPATSSLLLSRGSPPDESWQERDSGLEPQAAVEKAGDEMTLVLLSLMEHYRSSLGLTPNTDVTTGAVELLRRLITEREELVEEVETLRETLRTERLEWHQFQSDLQVAVSVADRLRVESDQALGSLQESHRAAEEQLAQALSSQRETDRELQRLRLEHKDVCRKLAELGPQQDALRNHSKAKDSEERRREEIQKDADEVRAKDQGESGEEGDKGVAEDETSESGDQQPKAKGVAEAYLRKLSAMDKNKGQAPKDPRKIVMLSERSWSLSRLPLSNDPSSRRAASINASTTLPLCKKEEPAKDRRIDRMLKRQDSWSNFSTGKQDEEQSSESIRPQDGFSALLRRHGGSRRNSLLRWCQSRTQGYKNIDITNFSSSWEDGLAFCAVYHTYLPTYIPFDSLKPSDKKENLDLAFRTGERVGITATLSVEEILKSDGPDWQRVLGYVESIFRHFET
ncbi:unnamed protein product [Ophioblennius macclurei]